MTNRLKNEIITKKNKFLDSIKNWRAKNAEWLLNGSDTDNIIDLDRHMEKDVRHPEDFFKP